MLVHLLCQLQRVEQLEAVVVDGLAASEEFVSAALTEAQRWHALALYWAQRGRAEQALDIWCRLAGAQLRELRAGSSTAALAIPSSQVDPGEGAGAGQAQAGAEESRQAELLRDVVAQAVKLLSGPEVCNAALVLRSLPWLVVASPGATLQLLCSRGDLDTSDALEKLPEAGASNLQWRYLNHVVAQGRGADPALHTRLALAMVECWVAGHRGLGEEPQMGAAAHQPAGVSAGDAPLLQAGKAPAGASGGSRAKQLQRCGALLPHCV